MDKYIIKNCNILYYNPDGTAICNDLTLEQSCYCKERTDCLLKRIYFKCEEAYAYGGKGLCSKIIKMLDIEECE